MDLSHTTPAEGGDPLAPLSAKIRIALWAVGVAVFALVLTAGFLAYLDPATLIEFASLRLCG